MKYSGNREVTSAGLTDLWLKVFVAVGGFLTSVPVGLDNGLAIKDLAAASSLYRSRKW